MTFRIESGGMDCTLDAPDMEVAFVEAVRLECAKSQPAELGLIMKGIRCGRRAKAYYISTEVVCKKAGCWNDKDAATQQPQHDPTNRGTR